MGSPASSYKCTSGSLAPNPDDCGSFLICDHQKYVTFKCATGQHFDSKLKVCNFPHAANCIANYGQGSTPINTDRPSWNNDISGGDHLLQHLLHICEDKHIFCAGIEMYCHEENVDWMNKNCQKTCGKCLSGKT